MKAKQERDHQPISRRHAEYNQNAMDVLVEEFILDRDCRRGAIGMRNFIQNWNRAPEGREERIQRVPDLEKLEPIEAAFLAAVVDSLCERDGYKTPAWVRQIPKLPQETFSLGKIGLPENREAELEAISEAPEACKRYNFFIHEGELDKGIPGLKQRELAEKLDWIMAD